ncbi:MAG: hypothetical protein IAE78_16740 [Myxococcus sp.]|nr:hypothetical protein [Myxococcus sp.]
MRPLVLAALTLAAPALADFKRLHAERATASSFLESNWNKYQENYHPTYVLDDDPATAWVEGVDGDGVGESLSVRVSALRAAKTLKLVITPGYQKSKALFTANGTPTGLEVTVRDAAEAITAQQALTLAPRWGAQTFEVPLKGGLASITLRVTAVKPGTKYRDTCLSDVQLFVDSEVPYDKRVEDAKRQAMLAWKQERLSAAKYFGALPATYPFASSAFRVKDLPVRVLGRRYARVSESNGEGGWLKGERDPAFVELDVRVERGVLPPEFDADDRAALKALRELMASPKGGRWFSASARPVRLPDGLDDLLLPEVMALVRASEVTLFEARADGLELKLKPVIRRGAVPREAALSTVRLLEGTAVAPRRVFAKHVEVVFERSDYELTSWLLIDWGDEGLLKRVTVWRDEAEISGGGRMMEAGVDPKAVPPEVRTLTHRAVEVWRFTVADAKIAAVSRQALRSSFGDPTSIEGLQADEGVSQLGAVFTALPTQAAAR